MNGVHDMGGMQGMGTIEIEPNEPAFHDDWERHMFGMFMALFPIGIYKIDELRHATERMGATKYLNTSYYEHWLHSLERMMVEKGQVAPDELEAAWKNAANAADAEGAV